MGASFLPITIFTVFWGIIGIVCPFFAPKGPNRGIIQVVLMLTAATCWLFWLCAYMAQMNPLIGPRLTNETLIWIARTWKYYHVYSNTDVWVICTWLRAVKVCDRCPICISTLKQNNPGNSYQ